MILLLESFRVCGAFLRGEVKWRFLSVVMAVGMTSLTSASRYGASGQKFEVKKHLKSLNKPAVKSIQTRPDYHSEELFDDNKVYAKPKEKETHIPLLWHLYDKCSQGTILMRRMFMFLKLMTE